MRNVLQKLLQSLPFLLLFRQRQQQDESQEEEVKQEEEEEEEEEVEDLAEDENQELTCEICIEPTLIADKKIRNTTKCSHPFCTDCMIKYIRMKLDDQNVGSIKCPALNCDHTLDPHAWGPIVGPSLFVRWCDVLCEEAIAGLDRCYCPFRRCNELIVNECAENVKKSKCPKCRKSLCFECKTVWHAGFRCEESGQFRDRNDIALGRLVERKKWKRCPGCRHFVELADGCRFVTCR